MNPAALAIRSARAEDLDALLRLEADSFDSDRLSRRSLRDLMRSESATVLVVERKAVLAGALVLLFRRSSPIARIYSLAVAHLSRGRGVGRALLRAAERAALKRGCAVLRLEVRSDNVAARSLYDGEGFTEIGRVENYYADGAEATRLERSLYPEIPAARAVP